MAKTYPCKKHIVQKKASSGLEILVWFTIAFVDKKAYSGFIDNYGRGRFRIPHSAMLMDP